VKRPRHSLYHAGLVWALHNGDLDSYSSDTGSAGSRLHGCLVPKGVGNLFDTIALVRQCLWSAAHLSTLPEKKDLVKIPRAFFERFTEALTLPRDLDKVELDEISPAGDRAKLKFLRHVCLFAAHLVQNAQFLIDS
jgi:hypothetical protein